MKYQILNGDALAEKMPDINGDIIICRECMIDGPVNANHLSHFLNERAKFIAEYFDTTIEHYNIRSKLEIQKMENIDIEDEVNLWFEDDLFCQTNFWFCVHLLYSQGVKNLFLVRPDHNEWSGFGYMSSSGLKAAFEKRTELLDSDVKYLSALWVAYQNEDILNLQSLSGQLIHLIPRLPEVIQAHLDRNRNKDEIGRPHKVLEKLKKEGKNEFGEVFRAFLKTEGIYGFGDLQVKNMWREIK